MLFSYTRKFIKLKSGHVLTQCLNSKSEYMYMHFIRSTSVVTSVIKKTEQELNYNSKQSPSLQAKYM